MKLRSQLVLTVFLFAFFAMLPSSVFAKDEWISVKSKNFYLVGNASEKEIRRAATKLEQFRETFRQLFSSTNLTASVPTNVIVFKNDNAYKPFKPKRADGKIDKFIAGYFQPGEDVNYITLSADGNDDQMYGTVFHEYVHFIMDMNFGKSEIPAWFNEGLAEYYQTFSIKDDREVTLGLAQDEHLALLQRTQLIPLETLFKISNFELHQNENRARSVFYAQSWALVHYIIQSNKTDNLGAFMDLVLKGSPHEAAFQAAFQMNFDQMEKELKKYVNQRTYKISVAKFEKKLTYDAEMETKPLSEASANAYLGDLLYHTNRADDAEEYLAKAIALEPNLSMAQSSMGMVKIQQRKFAEAKTFLEKAINDDQKNHIAFYQYAYLLSREALDEFGYATSIEPEIAAKMRGLLQKAIAINPSFTDSYELLAFISLVNNENLDEAVSFMRTALHYKPGNERYLLRTGDLYLRQQNFQESMKIAEKIAATSGDSANKARAKEMIARIRQSQELQAKRELSKKEYDEAIKNGARPVLVTRTNGSGLSPGEIQKVREKEELQALNQAIMKPANGERQVIGKITKVACSGENVTYTVNVNDGKELNLSSVGFMDLSVVTFSPNPDHKNVGCNADLSDKNAVLTFKTATSSESSDGELTSIDFVPDNFRFLTEKEWATLNGTEEDASEVIVPSNPPVDLEEQRRNAMLEQIARSMRKPESGETRKIGYLEKIECDKKGAIFVLSVANQMFKLRASTPETLQIRAYAPEVGQVQFGCGLKRIEVPVVFTYKAADKIKNEIAGDLSALEFVPKSFKLDQ
ncbi:MAG: DUF1570 domain-containing protein [Pyrinomonadaceae bacterium]|nr:DUF1570 domain-containing protein [Pyrinomonadaceae bacterium]